MNVCIFSPTPLLNPKEVYKNLPSNGQWSMIQGSCGSSKLVLPNSELLLFEKKLSSKF